MTILAPVMHSRTHALPVLERASSSACFGKAKFYCPEDPNDEDYVPECMDSCNLCHLDATPQQTDPHFKTQGSVCRRESANGGICAIERVNERIHHWLI